MIQAASAPGAGIFATVFGLVGLVLGVLGIFGQLKDALNTIWNVEPEKVGFLKAIGRNLSSLLIVGAAGLLLIASLSASAVIGAIDTWTGGAIPGGPVLWQVLNYAVTLGVLTVMFALIFKYVPDAKIGWSEVWPGAAITSILFTLGQIAIGLYLGFANVGSPFGAASSLVIILVWIFYSAQIIFFGAEITKAHALRSRKSIEPEPGARSTSRAELKVSPWFR
jgi:membrane protein